MTEIILLVVGSLLFAITTGASFVARGIALGRLTEHKNLHLQPVRVPVVSADQRRRSR